MNKRLILIICILVLLFALIPATAGLAVSDTTGIISVEFTSDVGYEDCFTYIRELAAIVFPTQTAEECGSKTYFFAGGVEFYRVDAQTINEKLTAIKAKSYVKTADDEPVSLTDDMVLNGDLNGDGVLDAVDYILLKKVVLGSASVSISKMYAADANSDRLVDAVDYLLVKKCVLGTAQPTEKPRFWRAPFTNKPGTPIQEDPVSVFESSDESSEISEISESGGSNESNIVSECSESNETSLISESSGSDESSVVSESSGSNESSSTSESSEASGTGGESSETSGTTSSKPGDNELPIIHIP